MNRLDVSANTVNFYPDEKPFIHYYIQSNQYNHTSSVRTNYNVRNKPTLTEKRLKSTVEMLTTKRKNTEFRIKWILE